MKKRTAISEEQAAKLVRLRVSAPLTYTAQLLGELFLISTPVVRSILLEAGVATGRNGTPTRANKARGYVRDDAERKSVEAAHNHNSGGALVQPWSERKRSEAVLPSVLPGSSIRPPTKAQLMAGR